MDGKITLLPTLDGSLTFYNQEIHQTYHSLNGALQEARHVFLENGLLHYLEKSQRREVSVLEVGFGSGLNFLVVADYCESKALSLSYCALEPFLLSKDLFMESGYNKWIHQQKIWNRLIASFPEPFIDHSLLPLGEFVKLELIKKKIQDFNSPKRFDLIFYDAFAPDTQPEMWESNTIEKVLSFLKPNGIFITYSITGNLKRIFRSLDFTIDRPKGAAGKREMFRAYQK
jgi:tRNA U34 5-methylaminomethyl-2-thiouridine-forming methyltransferase MnmC